MNHIEVILERIQMARRWRGICRHGQSMPRTSKAVASDQSNAMCTLRFTSSPRGTSHPCAVSIMGLRLGHEVDADWEDAEGTLNELTKPDEPSDTGGYSGI